MIPLLLSLGGLAGLAVGVLIFQVRHAADGHEDANGFHYDRASSRLRSARKAYKVEITPSSGPRATQHLPAT